jgi:DNA-binding LacI/PurR family transcriptional regulator
MPHFVSADEFWFTGKIVEGMTYAAQEKQINLSFERIPEEVYQKKPDGSSLLLDIIRSNSPQGIIWLHPGDHSEHISRIRKLGVEVITSMRQMSETDVPVVRDDDYAFSSQVLSALKSLGHRSVGIFVSSSENDEYYDTRVQALLDTAESLAMEVPVVIPIAEEEDPALQLKIAKNLLSTYNNLTAYVDMFAYGTRYFIRAMEEIPNEVPKDLALVYNVLDGIDIPKLPPQWGELSTITPPLFKIGEQLVSWLLARITNDGSYRPKRLVPVLEIRSSMKQKMS